MNEPAHIPRVRLLVAGIASLLLLSGIAFPIFRLFGETPGRIIPSFLCIFTLVILTPVVIRGSLGERLLALLLAVFPALFLLATILFSLAIVR